MIKEKIKNIIYSDDLTDYEIETFCTYDKGDSYDYGTYGAGWRFTNKQLEERCYQERVEQLADNLKEYGVANILNLPIKDEENKLTGACLRYLKDSFGLDSRWV